MAYEIDKEEMVNTYMIWQNEDEMYRIVSYRYYFQLLGEKTIEKLRGKGYLSMEEISQKYGILDIPILEQTKKTGFMKTLLQKKEKH